VGVPPPRGREHARLRARAVGHRARELAARRRIARPYQPCATTFRPRLLASTPVLHLARATHRDWARAALPHVDTLLVDHANCEKKAASTAVGLLFRYPERRALLDPLSRLAREELAHFEEVLRHLDRRGVSFGRLEPSPYAAELMAAVRPREPARLLDTLLCMSLIEARSCERMQLLAEALPDVDAQLAALYRGLLASEARHHASYVELACELELAPRAEVMARLAELAEHEVDVLRRSPPLPRLHTGGMD